MNTTASSHEEARRLAESHLRAQQFAQAARLFETILSGGYDDAIAYAGLARIALQTGRVHAAIELAHRATESAPSDADAHYLLGRALKSAGRLAAATTAYGIALQLAPERPDIHVSMAIALRAAGQEDEALQEYRRAIVLEPDMVEAHHNLGNLLAGRGALDEAAECYRRAIELSPTLAEAHYELGNIERRLGHPEAAAQRYQAAACSNAGHVLARLELAKVAHVGGRPAEARELLHSVIAQRPDLADAHHLMGVVLESEGDVEGAIRSYQACIDVAPECVKATAQLCELLRKKGEHQRALELLKGAVARVPQAAEPHGVMGRIYTDLYMMVEARTCFERALQLQPDQAWTNLQAGNACGLMGDTRLAIERIARARELDPDLHEALHFLGATYLGAAMPEEAMSCFQEGIARFDDPQLHRSLCCASNYMDRYTAEDILGVHREFGDRHARNILRFTVHRNSPDPDRRLRIGYVSPDLRRHSVARFIEPLLVHHDRDRFEVAAYFNCHRGDEVTERLRSLCDTWRHTADLSDDAFAQMVRADGIDILIDLAGHTTDNRLLGMARKPAPVQVTWLGYPTTTGIAAIDYRLTDWQVDPAGHEAFQSERPVRLPGCSLCFAAPEEAPAVAPLPAGSSGPITFGSFNNLAKLSTATLKLWAEVLRAMPDSRLLLKGLTDEYVRDHLLRRFTNAGISAGRIAFHDWEHDVANHFSVYSRVDIALDSYPYNGVTTTCEAMWMGVPVVSLYGSTHASRFGLSLLRAADRPDLAQHSREGFVGKCAELASDRARLADLRASLRQRLEASSLMDAPRFAKAFEDALRSMWTTWCASR
jgi:predicted O-linked N-acetylglucosamine transferase (SPINDLY family)